jgi:multicomponent Na+:H+ antiporter subunit B
MTSIILTTAARVVHPVLLLFSVFLLIRGHNDPGGGFSGGLVAASSFVLHAMVYDARAARRALRFNPQMLIGLGLLTSLLSGLIPLVVGEPFLTGLWVELRLPGLGTGHVGTPLLFDVGVYLVVIGITTLIILAVAEH